MSDFSKYLLFSLKSFPPLLLTEENKEVLLNLAFKLPDIYAKYLFGYEKRLCDDPGIIDFFVSSVKGTNASCCNVFFNNSCTAELERQYPQWQRLRKLYEEWDRPGSLHGRYLDIITHEYDYSSLKNNFYVPSVFLGFESLSKEERESATFELLNRSAVLKSSIEILTGCSISRRVNDILENVSNKSDIYNRISQAGMMLSRDNSPVKICICSNNYRNDPGAVLIGYGLEKFVPEFMEFFRSYGSFFDELVLSINVSDSGIFTSAMECYFRNKIQPPKEKRWKEVLDCLCSDGFCNKDIAEALLTYPVKKTMLPAAADGKEYPEFFAQGLHHIKFTPGADKNSFAKAYLWAGYNWRI